MSPVHNVISLKRNGINTGKSEDVDEDDHEMGKLLIKQIVEKTRQGSSKVLNAQRMLKSMNKQ